MDFQNNSRNPVYPGTPLPTYWDSIINGVLPKYKQGIQDFLSPAGVQPLPQPQNQDIWSGAASLEANGLQHMGEAAGNLPWRANAAAGNAGGAASGWLKDTFPGATGWMNEHLPNFAQTTEGDPSSTYPLWAGGNAVPKDYGPGPQMPADPMGAPQLPPSTPTPDDPLTTMLKQIMNGQGGGGGGVGHMPAVNLPAYPSTPVPQAAAPAPYDRTAIDKLLAQAKPADLPDGGEDQAMSLILGAAQGFDPHGSAGEILGRLVGPAAGSLQQERRFQHQEKSQHDRDMSAYYQALAGTEANIQDATLGRQDLANSTDYNNQVATRAAELEKYGTSREDAYKQAELEMQFQGLQLQGQQVVQGDVRNKLAAAGLYGRYGSGSGASMFKILSDVVSKGTPLPGVDMVSLQQTAMQAIEAQHPNLSAINPQLFNTQLKQTVSNMLLKMAQENPDLAKQWQQMYSHDTSSLDLMSVLGGGL